MFCVSIASSCWRICYAVVDDADRRPPRQQDDKNDDRIVAAERHIRRLEEQLQAQIATAEKTRADTSDVKDMMAAKIVGKSMLIDLFEYSFC